MGLGSKPIGKLESTFRKLDNQLEKEKKLSKEKPSKESKEEK